MRTEDIWITMTFIQLAEAVLDPQLMHEHPYGELPVCCVHELSTSWHFADEGGAVSVPTSTAEMVLRGTPEFVKAYPRCPPCAFLAPL